MNTFTWLLVGHLLGDWLLQNEWMAQGKKQRLLTLAGIVHALIYTLSTSGLLWLANSTRKQSPSYLSLSAFIFVTHWLIDATDIVERWMRFFRQSHLTVVRLMVDQTLHLIILAILTIPFSRRVK